MGWKLQLLADWCGGTLDPRYGETEITEITTDSRTAGAGSLFIAICGENADGHQYALPALEQGAAAVLVSTPVEKDVPQIVVEDTVKAYGKLAAGYRQLLDTRVVGVTGSVGKTTTKEMLASILETTYKTAKTERNHNNHLGLPMTILHMPEDTQYAVLEMGMNHFGEMAYLASIARPDIAVITNIGTAHVEYLGSREGILRAKLEILQGMDKKGIALFNGDEPLLWNLRERPGQKKIYFGIENPSCDILAEGVEQMDDGMSFRVRGMGACFEMYVPVVGMHAVYDALAAISVGLVIGVPPEKMQTALGHFHNTGSRQQILETCGMTVISDCYNASPESMEAALNVLGDLPAKGKRIAVLGNMLELGARSMAEHYRIGRIAVSKTDYLMAYGSYADRVITGAITGGMDPKKCQKFDHQDAMAISLTQLAEPGDILLFKGSRGTKMEKVMEKFLEDTKEKRGRNEE